MFPPFKTAAADMGQTKTSMAAIKPEGANVNLDLNMEHLPDTERKKVSVLENWKKKKPSCLVILSEILVILLGAVTIIVCLAEIIVTITAAATNKIYDAEQSGHMVTMVVLAVTSAITLSIVFYSFVGICKMHTKPLHTTAAVLFVVALIQALLTGLVVNVSESDHHLINKALTQSFRLSREGNARHVGLWSATQHDLECCGLNGPDDYRGLVPPMFPPNLPISCCGNYNPERPDSSQERDREICKAQRLYYEAGCRKPVIEMFLTTSQAVVICTAVLIALEVILAICSAISSTRPKERKINYPDAKDHHRTHKEVSLSAN